MKVSILDEGPRDMILNNNGAMGISMTLYTPDGNDIVQLIQPDQELAYNTTASNLRCSIFRRGVQALHHSAHRHLLDIR